MERCRCSLILPPSFILSSLSPPLLSPQAVLIMRASRGVARALRLLGILTLIVALGLLYKQISVAYYDHQAHEHDQQQQQRGRTEPDSPAACDVGMWAPWQQTCGADGMRYVKEGEKAKEQKGRQGMKGKIGERERWKESGGGRESESGRKGWASHSAANTGSRSIWDTHTKERKKWAETFKRLSLQTALRFNLTRIAHSSSPRCNSRKLLRSALTQATATPGGRPRAAHALVRASAAGRALSPRAAVLTWGVDRMERMQPDVRRG